MEPPPLEGSPPPKNTPGKDTYLNNDLKIDFDNVLRNSYPQ